jgi:hypothetical protein
VFWGIRVGGLRIAVAGREPTEAHVSSKQPLHPQDIEGMTRDVFDTQGLLNPAFTATFGAFDDFRGFTPVCESEKRESQVSSGTSALVEEKRPERDASCV